MSNIDELIDRTLTAIEKLHPQFSPTRYPYTYAADFLRSHAGIVPDEIAGASWRQFPSRGEASRMRRKWASELGMGDEDLARKFADAYLREHHINKPGSDLEDTKEVQS